MEMTLSSNFIAIEGSVMNDINGGGLLQAAAGFTGCIIIGFAPVAGVVVGIGGSVVGTPLVGVSLGIAAAAGMVASGSALLDYACK